MTDDITHNSLPWTFSSTMIQYNQKRIVFLKNDNSQYIVSDDTKIKPHNGFTENKFILHKAKQYCKHDIWSLKRHIQQLCKKI